jgi:triosephosphate isomerase
MRKPIIAGNWKMFKTTAEALDFVNQVKSQTEVNGNAVECVICAPSVSLAELVKASSQSSLKIGAQNLHFEDQGAFTGEVSGAMLKHIGVTYVIIGHSERRAYFAETDESVNKKVKAAYRHDLIPIICVGEKLEEREAGITERVCKTQVEAAFQDISPEQATKAIIAYEPIWAIGTGKSSTAQDAQSVIQYIRQLLVAQYGQAIASQVRIQYGGSVKPENIAEYMAQPDIDGALVGGASLQADSYVQLVGRAK